jgi:DNA-damage-inducible protein J
LWLRYARDLRAAIMPADDIVRARVDRAAKERAAAALADMGLSISDAIRLLMLRIADERRLPFAVEGAERDDAEGHRGDRKRQRESLLERRGPDGRPPQ